MPDHYPILLSLGYRTVPAGKSGPVRRPACPAGQPTPEPPLIRCGSVDSGRPPQSTPSS